MKDLCVFRCQCEDEMYRVMVFSHPTAPRGIYYVVYKGRRQALPVKYDSESDAVMKCVQLCCTEYYAKGKGVKQ